MKRREISMDIVNNLDIDKLFQRGRMIHLRVLLIGFIFPGMQKF
jgi:hypothetical protein